jgi:hypothetical protein
MAKYLIALLALVGLAIADDSSAYAAPAGGYAAPTGSYAPAASGYGPPDTGYPAPEYQQSYEAPSATYGGEVTDTADNPFDLSKLLAVLPLFLAVFAAIILAQLLAPLIGLLFGGLGGIGAIFAPLGTAKIDLINIVLNPFGLALCTNAVPPVAAMGRNLPSGFTLNRDVVDNVATMLYKAIENYSN